VTLKHAATDIFTNSGYLVALVASCRLQKDVSCFDVLDHGKIAQLYANVLQVRLSFCPPLHKFLVAVEQLQDDGFVNMRM
jgi:hypothetical protein